MNEEQVERIVAALKTKVASFPGLMSVDQLLRMCVYDTAMMIEGGEAAIRRFEGIAAPPKPEDIPPEPWAQ